jgi:hypothetical protein
MGRRALAIAILALPMVFDSLRSPRVLGPVSRSAAKAEGDPYNALK